MSNGKDSQEPTILSFRISESIIRQIDLVEDSPQVLAMKVQRLIGDIMEKKQVPPYALFWWSFNISASLAAQFNPKVLSYFKSITDEMYKEHYGEAAIRLGLVKTDESAESKETKTESVEENGLSSEPESDRKEPPVSETPSASRIKLLE